MKADIHPGSYGDKLRVSLLQEDLYTIFKGMITRNRLRHGKFGPLPVSASAQPFSFLDTDAGTDSEFIFNVGKLNSLDINERKY